MKAEALNPNPIHDAVPLKANYSSKDSKSSTNFESSRASWYTPQKGLPKKVNLKIFENSLVLDFPRVPDQFLKPPDRTGKKINKFSKKSRLRIMKKFNRIRTAELSEGIFITLTCRHYSITAEEFQKRFLKRFLPKLKTIIPNLAYAYRLEFHKSDFPHFHMFAWSTDKSEKLNEYRRKWQIKEAWWKIIEDDSAAARKHSCEIIRVNNRRKAFAYVSKYLAKTDDEESPDRIGRRWALSKNLNMNPISDRMISIEEAQMLLNAVKNLLKEKVHENVDLDKFLNDEGKTEAWLALHEIQYLLNPLRIDASFMDIRDYLQEHQAPPDNYI